MVHINNRKIETLIYAGLWGLAILFLLLNMMRGRSLANLPIFDSSTIGYMALNLLPFIALFAINCYLLIPRLLKRGKYGQYFISAISLVCLIWVWQRYQFYELIMRFGLPEHHQQPPENRPEPLMPLPLFMDMIYDFLIIGVNLAISLMFQHFDDRLQQELLMKKNAENQLTYLKAQINPHFYMNMLNNIHGMIEIDPAKAQDMVIEMSGLMRYTLYESSRPKIGLAAEIRFIRNYLDLMRERYPEDAVSIKADFPAEKEMNGIFVAPLLFLVFIENAFKHGISYSGRSFVAICMTLSEGTITFRCTNSVHPNQEPKSKDGIGLENARQRLDIIYGDRYTLNTEKDEDSYTVTLTLPYETEHSRD